MPEHGVVVELGPGREPKVAAGLALRGFVGELWLVDRDADALDDAVHAARRLLPGARIHPLAREIVDVPPIAADALVANHVLDDLVLAHAWPGAVDHYRRPLAGSVGSASAAWRASIPGLGPAVERVAGALDRVVQRLRPSRVILAQYPSWRMRLSGVVEADMAARAVVRRLLGTAATQAWAPTDAHHTPSRWLTWS